MKEGIIYTFIAVIFIYLAIHSLLIGEVEDEDGGIFVKRKNSPIIYWLFVASMIFVGILFICLAAISYVEG